MIGRNEHGESEEGWEFELRDGWRTYRQALVYLDRAEWPQALVLLAEAETTFRTYDSPQGLWRVLSAQALLHWREGAVALALARALAALRAAETADDSLAVGCVAWQVANMALGQGDYRKAADYLAQAQAMLDQVGMAPPGGALAAAAQLCTEIIRWQQVCERQQIGRREAKAAIAEVRRELIIRLNQAATTIRAAPVGAAQMDRSEVVFLAPEQPLTPTLLTGEQRPALVTRLTRWCRRLLYSDAAEQDVLARTPIALLVPAEPPPAAPEDANSADAAPEQSAPAPATETPDAAPTSEPPDPGAATPAAHPAALTPEEAPLLVRHTGLAIYCFGRFRVYLDDTPIERWESARGRTIFKYLVARRAASAPKELLADMFWPDSEPELARRSLHQAIYCLRQTFKQLCPNVQIVKFVGDRYQLSPETPVWVDCEEFGKAIELAQALRAAGEIEQAMQSYAVAIDLYGGTFLEEDRYEAWTEEPRRIYQAMYFEALHHLARYHQERGDHPAVVLLCQRALALESCDEESHQMLIASYMAQGLRHLAVRQYQICASALKTELGLAPSDELAAFYRRIVAAG